MSPNNCKNCGAEAHRKGTTWATICKQQGVPKGTLTYQQYKPDHMFTCVFCSECGMNTGHHETNDVAVKVWNRSAAANGNN